MYLLNYLIFSIFLKEDINNNYKNLGPWKKKNWELLSVCSTMG